MVRVVLLVVLVVGLSCCSTVPVANECPESVGLKCLTQKKCQMDSKRSCMVCRCSDALWDEDPIHQDDKMRGKIPE